MKRLLVPLILTVLVMPRADAYNDHRGHNLDSLERAVARWTPDGIDRASEEELLQLDRDYRDLMMGYSVINGEKSMFYARKALSISLPREWMASNADSYRYIGMLFYGREQYDSAMFYLKASLACVDSMAGGAVSPTDKAGYSQDTIDNYYSALYGTIGNLYNVMGDIPEAMAYYGKAGEIFEKYGWNESNSTLHYNMGETWLEEGDLRKAKDEYDKAMAYAEASGDSLMIVNVWKGYGGLYKEQGRTRKALGYLRKADAYYASNPTVSPDFRTENLEFMKEVLSRQKHRMGMLTGILTGLVLMAAGFFLQKRKTREKEERKQEKEAIETPELSAREKEILDLLTKGYTTPQIAEGLGLSAETIKWYRKKLLVKLDVSNTAELIATAKEMKLI